jgi:hypothetical protein
MARKRFVVSGRYLMAVQACGVDEGGKAQDANAGRTRGLGLEKHCGVTAWAPELSMMSPFPNTATSG